MSFILDALRKAEATRQGDPGRVLAVPHPVHRPPQATRVWLIPALALSLFTALITWWLLGSPAQTQAPARPAPARTPAAAPSGAAPTVDSERPGARSGVRRLALEAGAVTPPPASAPRRALAGARPSSSGAVQPGTVEVRDLLADNGGGLNRKDERSPRVAGGEVRTEKRAMTAADTARLPTMEDLMVAGHALPPLKMDLHVFRDIPEQRTVYINMRKYREGERTPEEVWIERITPEGVILGFDGRSFLLTNR